MLIQLFFTDELSQIVSRLEREGNLNRNAIRNMDMPIIYITIFIILFTIAVSVALELQYGWIGALIALAIGLSVIAFSVVSLAKSYVRIAYLLVAGDVTLATTVSFEKHRGGGFIHESWNVKYRYQVSGKEYHSVYRWTPRDLVERNEITEEKLQVAFDPQNPKRSIPMLSRIQLRLQLSSAKEE